MTEANSAVDSAVDSGTWRRPPVRRSCSACTLIRRC